MGCGNINPLDGFRGFNLVQNPSFQAGLAGWVHSENVSVSDRLPFEGTQVATMDINPASMYQDVSLAGTDCSPLFLSFNVVSNNQPDITVQVLWLDSNHNYIASGLEMYIKANTTDSANNGRVTFFDITDSPPPGAAFARLIFNKAEGFGESTVSIDQVILAPVGSANLLKNPSFEAGFISWSGANYSVSFETPLQGAADVTTALGGTLIQDVPIENQPSGSSYLFSFGAYAEGSVSLTAQVLWLDAGDNIIGSPGLEITIPSDILNQQENYLTYLDLTNPAPLNAVKARILFDSDVADGSRLRIDQVIFARAGSSNLLQNPSFEDGLNNWTDINGTTILGADVYEGEAAGSLDIIGGVFLQDVFIPNAEGNCFVLNYGIRARRNAGGGVTEHVIVKVLWLDDGGNEIGEGLTIVNYVRHNVGQFIQWLVYTGITEPAPPGTTAARIQITKLDSGTSNFGRIDIDKIVFGRLT
ncbi:MAG TPA: hypothetical protein GX498_06940 [Clostridiales bacterium]|nr:hypothetical protein [Clostridiales bacterium]